jgi:serine/threonine-protein kinase
VLLVVLVAGLVAAAYIAFWAWVVTGPKSVRVPNVVGIEDRAAVRMLQDAGLVPEVAEQRYDEDTGRGVVLSVKPPPNKVVRQGRKALLIVSLGSVWTRVPNLTEMSVSRAKELLAAGELELGRQREEYSDKVPVGYTISHSPGPGARARRGSRVDLIVSRGPVPEGVVERTRRSARVVVDLPPEGPWQEVRIMVQDDTGTRLAYHGWHMPGSKFTRTVSGTGTVTVRVYVGGQLVEERTL